MRRFQVRNWHKFQHYKDRRPCWIKLHNDLHDNYEFCRLQDASKAHLQGIWLLASRLGNDLPFDAEWIAKRISATESVDLEVLEKAGFIQIVDSPASKRLASRKQSAIPETETETERERVPGKKKKVIGGVMDTDMGVGPNAMIGRWEET